METVSFFIDRIYYTTKVVVEITAVVMKICLQPSAPTSNDRADDGRASRFSFKSNTRESGLLGILYFPLEIKLTNVWECLMHCFSYP